ncbi:ankyrin repeat-containing protein [Corynebacterium deserti GIMN1.010]|uniref:Ankyrin repeat-containing protein n=1 Tax=Corynebacterium deserti GIMN1.010 TaxID=931089 RepID=A0A0M4CEG9_9CORY|nr:ankyrin repeat domain-containing protein [Corynebacterium deserti]ALC06241.1 ankyrin repeat-containing protein [Corynebacterium deserti GIMN1.010]
MLPIASGNNDRNLINYVDGGRFDEIMLTGDLTGLNSFLTNAGPNARDDDDRTVLMRAAEAGNLMVVARLLDLGANPTITTDDGLTALHIAAMKGDDGIVECLIESGAALDATDNRGRTPLWYAAAHNLPDSSVVDVLLRAGANIRVRDINGVSPDDLM